MTELKHLKTFDIFIVQSGGLPFVKKNELNDSSEIRCAAVTVLDSRTVYFPSGIKVKRTGNLKDLLNKVL